MTPAVHLEHETRHRSPAVMERLARCRVTVCGAGALGANLAEGLARQGFGRRGAGWLRVVDRDRVEEANLATQPWTRGDVGAAKARILGHALYRATGAEVDGRAVELTPANAAALVEGSDLVVDCFDNSVARAAVRAACRAPADDGAARGGAPRPCLHVGLAAGYAEVLWDEVYRVPSAANDDVCDYPLARNLAQLAVAVACEVIVGFAATGARRSFTVTLGDLAVRPFGPERGDPERGYPERG